MNSLSAGQGLGRGEALASTTGKFTLTLQDDGNLVLADSGNPVWASGTEGKGADRLAVQDDGNVVLYAGGQALWATNTSGHSGARLELQDDRNVVVYAGDGAAVWATGTQTDQVDAAAAPAEPMVVEAASAPAAPPPPAPAPAPAPPAYQEYVVQSGDTLSAIAERYYGDANAYMRIAQFNGLDNPDLIFPGQALKIPN